MHHSIRNAMDVLLFAIYLLLIIVSYALAGETFALFVCLILICFYLYENQIDESPQSCGCSGSPARPPVVPRAMHHINREAELRDKPSEMLANFETGLPTCVPEKDSFLGPTHGFVDGEYNTSLHHRMGGRGDNLIFNNSKYRGTQIVRQNERLNRPNYMLATILKEEMDAVEHANWWEVDHLDL